MKSDDDARWSAKVVFIVFCLFAFPLLTALAFIDPASGAIASFDVCPFHAVTHLSCAGCGATRAAHELLNGHIPQALAYNPLFTILCPFIAYAILLWGVYAFSGKLLPMPKNKLPLALALLVATILFAVLRNIPDKPFNSLAPHALKNTEEGHPK